MDGIRRQKNGAKGEKNHAKQRREKQHFWEISRIVCLRWEGEEEREEGISVCSAKARDKQASGGGGGGNDFPHNGNCKVSSPSLSFRMAKTCVYFGEGGK